MDNEDWPGWLGRARTRRRFLRGPQLARARRYSEVYGYDDTDPEVYTQGVSEVTHDASRPAWKTAPAPWKHDAGNEFQSVKIGVQGVRNWNLRTAEGHFGWEGALAPAQEVASAIYWASGGTNPGPVPEVPSRTQLNGWGATAISRTIPTSPSVSVAQTLGELKEGLPSMIGKSSRKGDLGGEYLNFQFGISPIISDVEAYADTYRRSEEILTQWYRDSGRRVRRRYKFPESETVEVEYRGGGYYPHAIGAYSPSGAWHMRSGTLTVTRKRHQRVWFSGAYRYYIPDSYREWLREVRAFNRLYGLYPNPQTAWELMPWSWFIDWNTNAGDVIKNVSLLGRDDLVLTYGYLMAHTRVVTEFVWEGELCVNGAWSLHKLNASVVTDVKQRVRANPYGFSLDPSAYSAKQWAILAALGFTRGHNRLTPK